MIVSNCQLCLDLLHMASALVFDSHWLRSIFSHHNNNIIAFDCQASGPAHSLVQDSIIQAKDIRILHGLLLSVYLILSLIPVLCMHLLPAS